MRLYGYWRSSATYRVRIVLALKGLDYDYTPVNLLEAEQSDPAYLEKNPLALVPALETDGGDILVQSLAICEYLEEAFRAPALSPADPARRAQMRAVCATIACEAQPLMNLRIQRHLKNNLGADEAAMSDWLNSWPGAAMTAAARLVDTEGPFAFGAQPTLADAFIVPQVFAAQRFGLDLSGAARLVAIAEHCNTLEAFQKAHPKNQPDAVA